MASTTTTQALAKVNLLASHTALTAWGTLSDFLVILILVMFFFSFAWYVGRGPLVAILLAYYGAYAVYRTFLETPYAGYLPSAPLFTALLVHVALYAVLGFAFYVVMRRVVVSDFLYVGNVGLIILSLFAATFLIAMAYQVFDINSVFGTTSPLHFNHAMDVFFKPPEYFFWWFIAPAVALFFLAR
jgi:hypothetical protein